MYINSNSIFRSTSRFFLVTGAFGAPRTLDPPLLVRGPGVALAASPADRINFTAHRCARPLYFILPPRNARLTVTPNEIKGASPLLLPPSDPSLSIPRSLGRESRLRGSCCHLAYYSTPLSPLRTPLPGLFFFTRTHFLLSARENFVFLSSPPPTPSPRASALSRASVSRACCSRVLSRSFSLSLFSPFLSFYPRPSHRQIMQRITEKSKQARRNLPG